MPQDKGQESGGMLGQVVRWKITEPGRMDSGIFQLGKEQREQECCPTSEDWECSLLSGLHSLLQGRGGRVPESEGTAW